VDIVLHIHFNDYPGRSWHRPGEYSGFSIYVPEDELPNSRASIELAHTIKSRLLLFTAPSNLPGESDTVIPTQELIAIGSNASRDKISLLLEYDYIYESRYHNTDLRDASAQELAFLTYQGIKEYYEGENSIATSLLPHTWKSNLGKDDKGRDVLALQIALREEGVYPPEDTTLEECPMSGYYGLCTDRAVTVFQEKHKGIILDPLSLEEGTGFVGGSTRNLLNTLHGDAHEK